MNDGFGKFGEVEAAQGLKRENDQSFSFGRNFEEAKNEIGFVVEKVSNYFLVKALGPIGVETASNAETLHYFAFSPSVFRLQFLDTS